MVSQLDAFQSHIDAAEREGSAGPADTLLIPKEHRTSVVAVRREWKSSVGNDSAASAMTPSGATVDGCRSDGPDHRPADEIDGIVAADRNG